MSEIKSIREILEELAATDDRLRESFPKWLEELDRRKLPPKKGPASEAPPDSEDRAREGNG
jgi:rubrerythrin